MDPKGLKGNSEWIPRYFSLLTHNKQLSLLTFCYTPAGFGAKGDNRDFMPDWENNYLSWAFALGCVGALFDYIAGVLFIVEARIIARKEIAREQQYPMEKAV